MADADEIVVYDKAKWHYEADSFPADLSADHAFTHGGMFLGWMAAHDLLDADFLEDFREQVSAFCRREITGPRLLQIADGALVSDMFSAEGNAFMRAYYDLESGQYLTDFLTTLATDLPSEYHVSDSWANYERLSAAIDARFQTWRANQAPTS